MITLKGVFKVDRGEKWHILNLLKPTYSIIEMIKWVVWLLDILIEGDTRMEGWVFQHSEGERTKIHYMYEVFQEAMRDFQVR